MKETPAADEQSKRSSEAAMSKTTNRRKLLKQWWAISTGRYSEAIDLDVGMEQAVGGESPELVEPRKVEVLMVDWIRSNADRTEHWAGCILYVNQLEMFRLLSISAGGMSLSVSVKTYRHSEQNLKLIIICMCNTSVIFSVPDNQNWSWHVSAGLYSQW